MQNKEVEEMKAPKFFYKGVVIIFGLVFLGGCIEAAMIYPKLLGWVPQPLVPSKMRA